MENPAVIVDALRDFLLAIPALAARMTPVNSAGPPAIISYHGNPPQFCDFFAFLEQQPSPVTVVRWDSVFPTATPETSSEYAHQVSIWCVPMTRYTDLLSIILNSEVNGEPLHTTSLTPLCSFPDLLDATSFPIDYEGRAVVEVLQIRLSIPEIDSHSPPATIISDPTDPD